MQYGCVWLDVEGVGMTYCDGIMQVHNEEECRKTTGGQDRHVVEVLNQVL